MAGQFIEVDDEMVRTSFGGALRLFAESRNTATLTPGRILSRGGDQIPSARRYMTTFAVDASITCPCRSKTPHPEKGGLRIPGL